MYCNQHFNMMCPEVRFKKLGCQIDHRCSCLVDELYDTSDVTPPAEKAGKILSSNLYNSGRMKRNDPSAFRKRPDLSRTSAGGLMRTPASP